ncbi:hypothetical protein EMIT0P44_370001 [Pseudomonas sp. IT-P44]
MRARPGRAASSSDRGALLMESPLKDEDHSKKLSRSDAVRCNRSGGPLLFTGDGTFLLLYKTIIGPGLAVAARDLWCGKRIFARGLTTYFNTVLFASR